MNHITCEQMDNRVMAPGSWACPYACNTTHVCTASFSLMPLKLLTMQTYCATDNYDNCPVFLAKILRQRGREAMRNGG